MKTEVVSFRKTVGAFENSILKERVKDNGLIREVRIRFYPGQELALRVVPYVMHKGGKREELVTYSEGSNQFFSGDDDYFILPVNVDIEYDDELQIQVVNTASYDYTLSVDVVISYNVEG